MRRRLRGIWMTAACTLAVVALGAPAVASLQGTSWDLPVKVSGAAARVSPTKGTLPSRLTFGDGTFTLSPGFSGTYREGETPSAKGTLSPTAGELAAFLTERLEAAGAAKGVQVTSLAIGKVTSALTAKRRWPSLDLTVSLNVSYTVSATVAGKQVNAAKGSLNVSGKASNPELGIGASLAGSQWTLTTKDTVKVQGQSDPPSQGVYSLFLGPNVAEGLAEGRFVQVDDQNIPMGGQYRLDPTHPKVLFDFDTASLEDQLSGLLLAELPGITDLAFPALKVNSSATIQSATMRFSFTFNFTVTGSYWGQRFRISGSAVSKGPGVRVNGGPGDGAARVSPAGEQGAFPSPAGPTSSTLQFLAGQIAAELQGATPSAP